MNDSNKEKEISVQKKNINIEINKLKLNNNSIFGNEDLNNIQMNNLGNVKKNIKTNLNNNNWTEILYTNIVYNFSDESSFTNNSEESIKPKEEINEIKNQIIEKNINSDTTEKEIKTKNLLSISPTKAGNYSINEELTKKKKYKII